MSQNQQSSSDLPNTQVIKRPLEELSANSTNVARIKDENGKRLRSSLNETSIKSSPTRNMAAQMMLQLKYSKDHVVSNLNTEKFSNYVKPDHPPLEISLSQTSEVDSSVTKPISNKDNTNIEQQIEPKDSIQIQNTSTIHKSTIQEPFIESSNKIINNDVIKPLVHATSSSSIPTMHQSLSKTNLSHKEELCLEELSNHAFFQDIQNHPYTNNSMIIQKETKQPLMTSSSSSIHTLENTKSLSNSSSFLLNTKISNVSNQQMESSLLRKQNPIIVVDVTNEHKLMKNNHISTELFNKNPLTVESKSRKERSLGALTDLFLRYYGNYSDNTCIYLQEMAALLSVERRRVYDIINVLECIGIIHKLGNTKYEWKGFAYVLPALRSIKEELSKEGNPILNNNSTSISYTDNNNINNNINNINNINNNITNMDSSCSSFSSQSCASTTQSQVAIQSNNISKENLLPSHSMYSNSMRNMQIDVNPVKNHNLTASMNSEMKLSSTSSYIAPVTFTQYMKQNLYDFDAIGKNKNKKVKELSLLTASSSSSSAVPLSSVNTIFAMNSQNAKNSFNQIYGKTTVPCYSVQTHEQTSLQKTITNSLSQASISQSNNIINQSSLLVKNTMSLTNANSVNSVNNVNNNNINNNSNNNVNNVNINNNNNNNNVHDDAQTAEILRLKKERSLTMLTKRFLYIYISGTRDISLEIAAKSLLSCYDSSIVKNKIRRLYDISNILTTVGLTKKIDHVGFPCRSCYKWIGKINPEYCNYEIPDISFEQLTGDMNDSSQPAISRNVETPEEKDIRYMTATIACFKPVKLDVMPSPVDMRTYQIEKLNDFMKIYKEKYEEHIKSKK